MHITERDPARSFTVRLPIVMAAVILPLLFFSTPSYAFSLTGTVSNSSGSPINHAFVIACESSSSICGSGATSDTTDTQGRFSLTVSKDSYTVYAYADGYLGRFYGDSILSFPLKPSTATVFTVDDDLDIGQINLDPGDAGTRFCTEPRSGLANLVKIEIRKPDQSTFADLAIDSAAGAQVGCRITDATDRQRVELLLADGSTELSSILPPATQVKFSFVSPEERQPHLMLAIGAIDRGISYLGDIYAVELKTAEQISGTLPGILASRLDFTSIIRPEKLMKLGGEPFRGLVLATNGEFKQDPYVKDELEPSFSQDLQIPGETLFAADRGHVQALIPKGLIDWWQAPYTQYLAYLNKSSNPLSDVEASSLEASAILGARFTFSSKTTLSWRVPEEYLQKRPVIKQNSLRPNCVVVHRGELPWLSPSKSRLVSAKINCRKRSVLRAWLLGPTKKQVAYLGARRMNGRTTRTQRWRMPRKLRSDHYTLKVRAARAKKSGGQISFVPIRKGIPTVNRGRRSGRTRHGSSRSNRINGSSLNDRLFGYAGSDLQRGRRGNDLIRGGPGLDRLWGGAGLDILIGDADKDFLSGNSGNDLLISGPGEDRVYGGTGNDMIQAGGGNDQINPGDGDDSVQGSAGDDVIREAFGNDRLSGGDGDDYILGARGGDQITGGEGNDRLFGGPGRDSIVAGLGGDLIQGQRGPDTIDAGSGNNLVYGGANPDYILAGSGNDRVYPGSDTDTVDTGAGDDYIDSADHLKEEIDCGSGNDNVRMYRYKSPLPGAYTNEDKVKRCEQKEFVPYSDSNTPDDPSEAGNVISGTKKSDTLKGTKGPDTILGSDGNDVIFGMLGNDVLEGEKGNDRVRAGGGDDIISGRSGNDWIWGGSGNDRIYGNRGRDHIYGGSGSDRIHGGFGRDVIRAGAGNDRVVTVGPKKEVDRISCGRGRDVVHANRNDRVSRSCEKVVRR